MTIRDNIKAVKKRILSEIDQPNKPFTREVQDKALAAILKGFGENPQCEEYMKLFADAATPAQLERLMARDNTEGDAGMNRARAYLMANGPCGSGTVLSFERGVTAVLDLGLPQG